MNYLGKMVTGKAKDAIVGLGCTAEMYNVDLWSCIYQVFEKTSSCVNVLTQINYLGDLGSGAFLESATRKVTLDMKTKWLKYVKQGNMFQPGLAVFSEWLNEKTDIQN